MNYGIGGQTTKECSARIDEIAKKNYDKVVMLCGINDIGHGLTNDEIIANYKKMFAALKANDPNIEIFVISVLPTTPVFYTDSQDLIVALDADLKALTESYDNVTYVDCYSAFIGEDGYCKEGITFDGLHPNLDGYALIAEILVPYLTSNAPIITPESKNDNLAQNTSEKNTDFSSDALNESTEANNDKKLAASANNNDINPNTGAAAAAFSGAAVFVLAAAIVTNKKSK